MTVTKSFFIKDMRISVHMLSAVSLVALIMTQPPKYAAILLFCAFAHEFGHFAAIKLCGGKAEELCFLPFGAEIKFSGMLNYKKELAIYACGPFANLVLGCIFTLPYLFFPCPELIFGAACCFFLMAINLVPAVGLDGGNIVRCIILSSVKYEKALKMINISELCALIILSFAATATVIFFRFNLSVMAICVYLFFQTASSNTLFRAACQSLNAY